jgi:hypothetical protein
VEAVSLLSPVAIFRMVTGYKIVQVLPAGRVRLEGEVLVGAEIIDPELLRPGLFAGNTPIKEEYVRLRVEDTRRQA